MEPTEISYGMLRTAEGQNNAVFACFGSAAQHAQHLEVALVEFLVVYNKVANTNLTVDDLESLDKELAKKTIGKLLPELRKYVRTDSAKVDRCLERALRDRNFLMHHYFREREKGLSEEKSRFQMLNEPTEKRWSSLLISWTTACGLCGFFQSRAKS